MIGGDFKIMAAHGWWGRNYGWSWVVVSCGDKVMAGCGWSWMAARLSNARNKSLCESSVKKSFQYQIAEFCYNDKFEVETLALKKSRCNKLTKDELQVEILLYIGYEDFLEKVIFFRLFNWVAICIRVSTRSSSWNQFSVANGRGCLFRSACFFFNLLT